MNFKRALTRKVGPLAAGWWLAILAGAILVYRQFRGSSSTAADTTSSTDTGAAAAAGYGTPTVAGGGAGADSGLQPDQPSAQTIADPALSGPGTAVIFDPLTGDATAVNPDTGEAIAAAIGPPPTAAFSVNQGQDPVLGGSRVGIGRLVPARTGKPAHTRGQRTAPKATKAPKKTAAAPQTHVARTRTAPITRPPAPAAEKKKVQRHRGNATSRVSVARLVQPQHAGLVAPPVRVAPTRATQAVTRTPSVTPTLPPTLPTPETRPPARITRPIAV